MRGPSKAVMWLDKPGSLVSRPFSSSSAWVKQTPSTGVSGARRWYGAAGRSRGEGHSALLSGKLVREVRPEPLPSDAAIGAGIDSTGVR